MSVMWQGLKNIYHLFAAFLANIIYGFPSRKLIVMGVTGTDGKTTTVSLIYHILHQAGYNSSMVSSVGAIIGGEKYDVGFHVTTPSSFALQKFIKKAVYAAKNKEKAYLVLETTSHALDQHRIFGIKFKIGVLTNVTHEHLDYHKTYENYVKAKARLLKMADVAIINKDDGSYKIISDLKNQNFITYGMSDADVNPQNFPFKTNLIGEFNTYNILAAVSACKALGLRDEDVKKGIASFRAPVGREEIVYKKEFTVMIDFAHTPNAFDKILSSVRKETKGRIIHVFGSAGERDKTKRPLMGKITSKHSDIIVITAEDPRSESVENINKDIERGISSTFKQKSVQTYKDNGQKKIYFKINDRKEAINLAIQIAKKGDLVILTGKSHEKSMNYGSGEVSWNEYEAAKQAIKAKN